MHGATCLGENDHVLRPAILWNDGRSHTQCEQMMADMPSLPSIAGNLAMPGFTAPKFYHSQGSLVTTCPSSMKAMTLRVS